MLATSVLSCLLLGTPGADRINRLEDTPEWADYRAEILQAKAVSMTTDVVGRRTDRSALITFFSVSKNSSGSFLVFNEGIEQRWDGKKGIGVDTLMHTWHPIKAVTVEFPMNLLRLTGEARTDYFPISARLTRTRFENQGAANEVGWEMSIRERHRVGRVTVWFDLSTHLPTEVSSAATGSIYGSETTAISTVFMNWDLHPAKETAITMVPPVGYSLEEDEG